MSVFSACATILYVAIILTALYILEEKMLSKSDDRTVVKLALFSSLCYSVVTMELTGSILVDLVTSQFELEMINQDTVSKRAQIRKLKE